VAIEHGVLHILKETYIQKETCTQKETNRQKETNKQKDGVISVTKETYIQGETSMEMFFCDGRDLQAGGNVHEGAFWGLKRPIYREKHTCEFFLVTAEIYI